MTPNELRAELKARGAENQYHAAALLGVSQMTISRWLRGKARIHPGTIAYLNVTKAKNGRTRKTSKG